MKTRSFWDYKEDSNGQSFTIPSVTCPDLSYSIKQLVADYSIGQLPTNAMLQEYLEDGYNDDDMDTSNDVRFADRADALEQYLAANNIRRTIFDKVKAQHDFKKKQEKAELERYRTKFGELESDR